MRFVVLLRARNGDLTIVGPYRSFRRAEGDAKAWDGGGLTTSVEPLWRCAAAWHSPRDNTGNGG